jgi:hypothetical protein
MKSLMAIIAFVGLIGCVIGVWQINVARSPDAANAGACLASVGAILLCVSGVWYWLQ